MSDKRFLGCNQSNQQNVVAMETVSLEEKNVGKTEN